MWKEVDGQQTSVGQQLHNLSSKLYRTNDLANIEVMDC